MSEVYDLVIECENTLGIIYPHNYDLWRNRAQACVRLERAMKAQDPPATVDDVRLAIAYCKQRRQGVDSPAHLMKYIPRAKAAAAQPERITDLSRAISAAIDWELAKRDKDSSGWIARLVRSEGPYRADTLEEWMEAGRGK